MAALPPPSIKPPRPGRPASTLTCPPPLTSSSVWLSRSATNRAPNKLALAAPNEKASATGEGITALIWEAPPAAVPAAVPA